MLFCARQQALLVLAYLRDGRDVLSVSFSPARCEEELYQR
jgi:hypothetical protein